MQSQIANTYSIVAYDPEGDQLGVAVQSHFFCVGSLAPWAEAGVGAVATQSYVEISYGPLGLEMMRAGKNAEQTLNGLLASDPQADTRQVAMVDTQGNVATHTGARCIAEAGHRQGQNYSVQANLMLKDTVWDAMAQAYEDSTGDLAERMLAAMEAAEAEGGDLRGKQSAALLVVSGQPAGTPWSGRVFDLRVDDNPEPLNELRRLVALSRAYIQAAKASQSHSQEPLDSTTLEAAAQQIQNVIQTPELAGNLEPLFWYAVNLVSVGQVDAALPFFKQVFEEDPRWRELIPRLASVDYIPNQTALVEQILESG